MGPINTVYHGPILKYHGLALYSAGIYCLEDKATGIDFDPSLSRNAYYQNWLTQQRAPLFEDAKTEQELQTDKWAAHLCPDCMGSLQEGNIPEFSILNDWDLGDELPEELKDLTWLEHLCIACAYTNIFVVTLCGMGTVD